MNSPHTGHEPPANLGDQDGGAPACVLSFNASDPSGASGIGADIATISAMGAHALPVVTSILVRDTAEIFESFDIDSDAVVEQARSILEDATIASWKVGFLGTAEGVARWQRFCPITATYHWCPIFQTSHGWKRMRRWPISMPSVN